MSEVIQQDFGKTKREAARTLSRLLQLADDQKAELENDPVRLFGFAMQEIASLHRQIDQAKRILDQPMPDAALVSDVPHLSPNDMRTLIVDAGEYERLKLCADAVRGMKTV